MKVIEVVENFVIGQDKKVGNTQSKSGKLLLHDHPVCHRSAGNGFTHYHFQWCGWFTKTTAARINKVLAEIGANHRVRYAKGSNFNDFIVIVHKNGAVEKYNA